jgi:hypothetical protein
VTGILRKNIRAAVRTALSGLPGFSEISAWQQTVDASALPAWAVATPSSRHNRLSNVGNVEHAPMLMVIVKRAASADDIEDALDDDADTISPLILAAIKAASTDCELTETAIRVDRSGAEPIGTLTLQFQITSYD